nr:MAG TPA: hypothetical protein [Caudoviricetes sp.]
MTSNVVICKHARQYKIIVNNQKSLKGDYELWQRRNR